MCKKKQESEKDDAKVTCEICIDCPFHDNPIKLNF